MEHFILEKKCFVKWDQLFTSVTKPNKPLKAGARFDRSRLVKLRQISRKSDQVNRVSLTNSTLQAPSKRGYSYKPVQDVVTLGAGNKKGVDTALFSLLTFFFFPFQC